jgi:AcrR family transcriptional regulator
MPDKASAAPGKKKKRPTQEDRRLQSGQSLVQAAVALIAEQGVGAATFRNIGARAGYSPSLVTQRFGAKQPLIDAVMQFSRDEFERYLADGAVDLLPGLDAILAYMNVYLTNQSLNNTLKSYIRLLSEAIAEASDRREVFKVEHRRVRTRLAALVERGQADGSIRREMDADAAAVIIGGLQLGMSVHLLVDPQTDLAPVRQMMMKIIKSSFARE